MKQTAVEWLEDNIQSDMDYLQILYLIEQAKKMEKEQIMKSFANGKINGNKNWANRYYNQTFKSE